MNGKSGKEVLEAIIIDYGIAEDYNGKYNLRFDDTNPTKEDVEYVNAIKEDVSWLGFDWQNREYYASNYFEQLFEYAVQLIKAGKAYVDSLSAEEIREYRGTLTGPRGLPAGPGRPTRRDAAHRRGHAAQPHPPSRA